MKLKVKETNYRNKRHQYITGFDFDNFIKENSEYAATELNKILDVKLDSKSENLSQLIFKILKDRNIILRASQVLDDKKKYPKKLVKFEEVPVSDQESCDEEEDEKPKEKKNKKVNFNKLDVNGYYILFLETSKSSLYFYLGLIIFGILAFCLLPVWPLEFKIFIWWVSYILLIIMLGLIIIRLILYGFFLIFGKEVWLFPELFNDNVR